MCRLFVKYILAAGLLALAASCGIGGPKASDPLPADQLENTLQQSFQSADAPTRDALGKVIQKFKDHDVAAAFRDVKALASEPGLTKEQRINAIRAGNTISQMLQDAAQKGDAQAADMIRSYNGSH